MDAIPFEMIMACCLGIALAAACGFRVFMPMLVVSAAANAQWLTLSESFAWVGTWPALLAFAVATVIEIGAYYVPWLDNLLDTISVPAAVVAGVVVSGGTMVDDMNPFLAWSLALIAGGGAAATVSAGTSAVRATSSVVTAGLGNPVVSTLEWVAAFALSVLAVVLPILAGVAVVFLLIVAFRFIWRWSQRRRTVPVKGSAV